MNSFEKRILDEYVHNHSKDLVKTAADVSRQMKDTADFQEIYQHEISVMSLYRVSYLALMEYHQCLSRYLKERGIELPDFATLTDTRDGQS